jgi:hypothetical protein
MVKNTRSVANVGAMSSERTSMMQTCGSATPAKLSGGVEGQAELIAGFLNLVLRAIDPYEKLPQPNRALL